MQTDHLQQKMDLSTELSFGSVGLKQRSRLKDETVNNARSLMVLVKSALRPVNLHTIFSANMLEVSDFANIQVFLDFQTTMMLLCRWFYADFM
jgi:hypothetical protein